MTLDLTKPVQTREGLPAEIVRTDMGGSTPILAVVTPGSGIKYPVMTRLDGQQYSAVAPSDLVNAPEPKRYVWLNAHPHGALYVYSTRRAADNAAGTEATTDRISCQKFEIIPGKFDD